MSLVNKRYRSDQEPAPDAISAGAVMALCAVIDERVTHEALTAMRAWITWQRLSGLTDDELRLDLSLIEKMEKTLGVQ
jgi:hypothetical protein